MRKFKNFLTEHKEEIKEIVSKNPTTISKEELNEDWEEAMQACSQFAKETNLTSKEIKEALDIVRDKK